VADRIEVQTFGSQIKLPVGLDNAERPTTSKTVDGDHSFTESTPERRRVIEFLVAQARWAEKRLIPTSPGNRSLLGLFPKRKSNRPANRRNTELARALPTEVSNSPLPDRGPRIGNHRAVARDEKRSTCASQRLADRHLVLPRWDRPPTRRRANRRPRSTRSLANLVSISADSASKSKRRSLGRPQRKLIHDERIPHSNGLANENCWLRNAQPVPIPDTCPLI